MKRIIIQIIAFLSLSTTVLAQNKKLDSLFGDFEGSVMTTSGNIFEKYHNGYIFSMKIIVDKNGSVKGLSISDNVEKSMSKDFFIKNKSKLKLGYFNEIAKYDKLQSDATYIALIILINEFPENKINLSEAYKIPNIFKYDELEGNLKNVTIIKPCVIFTARYN